MFILGNAVMFLPKKNANEFTFTGFLIGFILSIAVYFLSSKIYFYVLESNNNIFLKKAVTVILLTVLAVFAFFCAGETFLSLGRFITKVMLPKTPPFFAFLILFAVVVYFSLKRQENVLKFALISLVLTGIVIIFFFFAAMDKYDLRNIFIFRLPNLKEIIKQTKPYLLNPIIPVLLLPLYNIFTFDKEMKKAGVSGIVIGQIFLGITILTSVLLFGADFAGRLDFPYSSAISTVTVGRLFTRLDGFSFFIYFVSGIIKITVSVFVVFSCLKKLKEIIPG